MSEKTSAMITLKLSEEVLHIMDIFIIVIAIVGGVAGLLSTLYLTFAIPAVLVWKFFRRVRYGISIMN